MDDVKLASADHPIHELIARRWSLYSFDDRPVEAEDLRSIFEAARWAPSSRNEQPWRYIVATKDDPAEHAKLLSCLTAGNQVWAQAAPVLALGIVKLAFTRDDAPNRVALHDLGLASATLSLEATARGIYVHQMAGIVPQLARELYAIPEDFAPATALAMGYRADPDRLPDPYRTRDRTPRTRRALREFVFGGSWGSPSAVAR
jgi:nitroreductase